MVHLAGNYVKTIRCTSGPDSIIPLHNEMAVILPKITHYCDWNHYRGPAIAILCLYH